MTRQWRRLPWMKAVGLLPWCSACSRLFAVVRLVLRGTDPFLFGSRQI
jgi:hypothetical protein